MADDEGTTAAAVATETAPEAPATDAGFGKLLEQMEGFTTVVTSKLSDIEERQGRFEQALAEDPEPAPEWQPALGPQDLDAQGQITPEAANRVLKEIVAAQVEAELGPERQRAAQERMSSEAAALEQRYPELADDKQQKVWIDKAAAVAAQLAKGDRDRQLALLQEPRLLEMVYLSERGGDGAAQSSVGADGREVPLEAAAGAGRAGEQDQGVDIAAGIVKLAQQRKLKLRL